MSFSKEVQAKLGHYVYGLRDPKTKEYFYIGKASGNNRAYQHLNGDSKGEAGSKQSKIKQIKDDGNEPEVIIIRHDLDSSEVAHEVEAAIIDAIGFQNLTNKQRGHHTAKGIILSKEAKRKYGAVTLSVSEIENNSIGFFIQQTYYPEINDFELYDATRQFWGVAKNKIEKKDSNGSLSYTNALAIYNSIVVGVFTIASWHKNGTTMSSRKMKKAEGNKWEFVGNIIEDHELLGKKLVDSEGKPIQANQNGFTYFDAC